MKRAALLGLFALSGASCFDTTVPTGTVVLCRSDADCPAGWTCREDSERCISPDDIVALPPAVSGVFVQPRRIGEGGRVQLSFRVEGEMADPPSAFFETGDFTVAPLGRIAFAAPSLDEGVYVFPYDVGGGDPEGTHDVIVALVDRQGVVHDEVVSSVTFDFTAPALLGPAVVVPATLAPGGVALVRLLADEELHDGLTLLADDGVDVTELAPLVNQGGGVSFAYSLPLGTVADRVTFRLPSLIDLAGNENTSIGEVGEVVVDRAPPLITGLNVNAERFSRLPPHNALELSFQVDDAAAFGAEIFDESMDCAGEGSGPSAVVCTWLFSDADPAGPADITVRALDDVGNVTSAFASVMLDADGPQVLSSSIDARIVSDSAAILDPPAALKAGATLQVTFGVDEPLGAAPTLTTGDGADFMLVEQLGQTVTFAWTVAPEDPEGTVTVTATLLDTVGNGRDVELDLPLEVRVDHQAPAPPRTDLDRAVVLRRSPWGTAAHAGAMTSVRGLPGAAPGAFLVRVLDESGAELGRALVDGQGGFPPIVLAGVDRAQLWIMAVDDAGNASSAERVVDGEYVTTLSGKVAGQVTPNPHRLVAVRDLLAGLQQSGTEPERSGEAIAIEDGVLEQAVTSRTWQRPGATGRGPVLTGSAAYDGVRGRGVIYSTATVIGGIPAGPQLSEWDGAGWVLDTGARGGLPHARTTSAMAFDDARAVSVLAAGAIATGGLTAETWTYDGVSWSLLPSTGDLTPRASAAMAFDTARAVTVLFGGLGQGGDLLGDTLELVGDLWVARTDVTLGPSPRRGHALVYDEQESRLVLYGGSDALGETAGVWTFDGTSWSDRAAVLVGDPLPTAVAPLAAWDAVRRQVLLVPRGVDDVFVLTGDVVTGFPDALPGLGASLSVNLLSTPDGPILSYDATTLRWNGTAFEDITQRSPGERSRGRHALTFDRERDVGVLFGGYGSSSSPYFSAAGAPDDLYTWTPEDGWVAPVGQALGASGKPLWRNAHAMVFDEARGVVVMFGGFLGWDSELSMPNLTDETWTWDGAAWAKVTPVGGPSARYGHRMVYDPDQGRVVLYGGVDEAGTTLSDMWTWDGGAWMAAPQPLIHPQVRAFDMAYDRARHLLVLFGGELDVAGGLTTADLWTWDAAPKLWTRVLEPLDPELDGHPSARSNHRMVFDETLGEVLLIGGTVTQPYGSGVPPVPDAWAWTGTSWRRVDIGNSEPRPVPSYLVDYALTWDHGQGAALLVGADDVWTVSSLGQRPAQVAELFLGALLLEGPELIDIEARAVARGAGGVRLLGWERPEGWQLLDEDLSAGAQAGELVGLLPVAALGIVRERAHIAVAAVEVSDASGPVAVEVDALEVTVRYRAQDP